MNARLHNRTIEDRVIIAEFQISDSFTFLPGEYVQIILPNGGEKRYFSVMSSPNERGVIRIGTRPGPSRFKKTLQYMPLGTEVQVNGPWGDLLLPKNNSKPLAFIAGGIGITPFLSMLAYVAEEKLPYKIALLYFTHDRLFEKDLLRVIGEKGNGKLIISGERVSRDFFKKNLSDFSHQLFFLAGPPGFVNETLNLLIELQVPPTQILYESYTGY